MLQTLNFSTRNNIYSYMTSNVLVASKKYRQPIMHTQCMKSCLRKYLNFAFEKKVLSSQGGHVSVFRNVFTNGRNLASSQTSTAVDPSYTRARCWQVEPSWILMRFRFRDIRLAVESSSSPLDSSCASQRLTWTNFRTYRDKKSKKQEIPQV